MNKNSLKITLSAIALALTASTGSFAADAPIYGSQLMSNQERVEHRNKMRSAKTAKNVSKFVCSTMSKCNYVPRNNVLPCLTLLRLKEAGKVAAWGRAVVWVEWALAEAWGQDGAANLRSLASGQTRCQT